MKTNLYTNTPRTSFGASIICKTKLNKDRWNNIGKIFEEKTQVFPKHKLYIERDLVSGDYYKLSVGKPGDRDRTQMYVDNSVIGMLLANKNDKQIANKLVKIFGILGLEKYINKKVNRINKYVYGGEADLSAKEVDEILSNIHTAKNKFLEFTYNVLNDDDVLKPVAKQYNIYE